MYNTKYVCNYDKISSIQENDDMCDIIYRDDVLHIFECDKFDIFNTTIPELHQKMVTHEKFKDCMERAAALIISENTELGLCILYSYDYMYITHECVSEYLDYGVISDDKIEKLLELINQ